MPGGKGGGGLWLARFRESFPASGSADASLSELEYQLSLAYEVRSRCYSLHLLHHYTLVSNGALSSGCPIGMAGLSFRVLSRPSDR